MKILKIYYDGGCYFCTRYTEFLELKKNFQQIEFISLRENTEILTKFQSMGLKYNLGMVVEYDNKFYFGNKAFAFLNVQNDSKNILSKLNKFISSNSVLNIFLYNILVIFRYIFLIIQFKTIIHNSKTNYNASELVIFRISIFFIIFCNLYIFKTYELSNIKNILLLCSSFLLILAFFYSIFFKFLNEKLINFFKKLSSRNLILYIFFIHCFVHISYLHSDYFVTYRRLIFFVLLVPLIFYFYKKLINSFKDKKKYIFIFLISIILSISPGFYIVPYYGGISGWVVPSLTKPFGWSEYFIVNDQNEKILYNHLFLQPNTMIYRFRKAFDSSHKRNYPKAKKGSTEKDYMNFLYQNYLRNYSKIEEGKLPHQRIFRSYSYNGHTLGYYNAKDYKKFSPKNIYSIDKIYFKFNLSGELLSSETVKSLKITD